MSLHVLEDCNSVARQLYHPIVSWATFQTTLLFLLPDKYLNMVTSWTAQCICLADCHSLTKRQTPYDYIYG